MKKRLVLFSLALWIQVAYGQSYQTVLPFCESFVSSLAPLAHYVNDLDLTPDGKYLAAATLDGVEIYDVQTWQLEKLLPANIPQDKPIRWPSDSTYITWSPDNSHLAVSYNYTLALEGTPISYVNIWNIETESIIGTIPSSGIELAWSPVGNELANVMRGSIEIWDTQRLEMIGQTGDHFVTEIDWYPDGNAITGVEYDGVWTWKLSDFRPITLLTEAESNGGSSLLIKWSPDGQRFALSTILGLEIYDETGILVLNFRPNMDIVSMDWSADNRYLALGTKHGFIILDTETKLPTFYITYDYEVPDFQHIFWIPDTEFIISANDNSNIYKWDIEHECLAGIIETNNEPTGD